jgi:hypothetical protein
MAFNRAQFLIEVLGPDAARALAKAASRSEYLAQMIVPRTILAMLDAVPAFTGTIPGFDDCSLTYAKSEKGFTGNVTLGEDFYKFEAQSIFHVAGAISTAMSLDTLMFTTGRNTELQRLGKSIDLMAKAHLVGEESDKKPGKCVVCGGKGGKHNDRLVAGQVLKCRNAKLEKKAMGEGSGKSAGPVAPAAPQAPTATAPPATTQQKLPKNPGSPSVPKPPKPVTSSTVKLTRSEQTRACPVCSMRQFSADDRFVGCLCFKALAKSAMVVSSDEGTVTMQLGSDWDSDTIVTFLETVGR